MLSVSNISKTYSGRYLFSGISFNIGMRDRIAVIGSNGTGKTTLFEIISGNLSPDSGTISMRKDTTIGYLKQDINPTSGQQLLEEVSKSSNRINTLAHKIQLLQAELAGLKRQIALGDIGNVTGRGASIAAAEGKAAAIGTATGTGANAAQPDAKEINGVKFFARSLTGISPKDLRGLIDEYKSRLGSGAVLLIADSGGKAAVAAGVTDDLTARVSAVDLVRAAVEAVGGKGGGGRPDMAQGGGPDASKAGDAIRAAEALLEG